MAKTKPDASNDESDSNARLVTSEEDKAKATKWFARARELGDKRQFDYAIEYYVNGLEFWPGAVEEACKPLHGCGVARRQTGGKKPGLKDSMKRSMNDKDPKRAFLNAAWLFGHDPDKVDYIEGMAKAANRLRADEAARWAGGVCRKALETLPKVPVKQFLALAALFEEIAERSADNGDCAFAVDTLKMGVEVLHLARQRFPKDRNTENALRNLSTELTILKGKYQESESFQDSIVDKGTQKELHDRDLSVQSDQRLEELIANATAAQQEAPDDARALMRLTDLLCRRENPEDEHKAIGILVAQHNRTKDYRHKHQADDIRMKQFGRAVREAAKTGDPEAVKKAQIASLRFDLAVFKQRVERYPTDNRVKFDYGVRLFRAGRFDDAIPILQVARADAKNRTACGMYVGRCFYRKGYHPQAIAALEQELADHPYDDDDLAKSMTYWLGRAQEESGEHEAARATYGKMLQVDYNYKDARARLDGLPKSG